MKFHLSSSMIIYITTFINGSISSTNNGTGTWDYREEGNSIFDWIDEYPECGYSHQSPINIDIENCEWSESIDINLEWSHHLQHYAVRNNGHSLQAIPFQVVDEEGSELSFIQNVLHHTNSTKIKLQNAFYNTYKSPIHSGEVFLN